MHMLCYTSNYTGKDIYLDLEDIVTTAKANNPQHSITGVLFCHNNTFVQVLEGEENELDKVMEKINKDPRHNNIKILVKKEINKHYLSQWNMDSFHLSDEENLDIEELEKVRDAFEANILPRSDELIQVFKLLIEKGAFREKQSQPHTYS